MTSIPDLALVPQPQINVTCEHTGSSGLGLSAHVTIDGQDREWVLLTDLDGEGWHLYETHTLPVDATDGWTSPLRLPKFRHHPVPQDPRSMIEFCRWFFAPKAEQ